MAKTEGKTSAAKKTSKAKKTNDTAAAETSHFEADVAKLLHLVAHSLYSNKEVFLRELVSNASDACDKLRYQALTNPELCKDDEEFSINISVDNELRQLIITDNGIGMSKDDLKEHLGTIARSGTQHFMDQIKESKSNDASLIGQFGVGFYSSFMIADKVDVTSKKAGEAQAHTWISDGLGTFTIAPSDRQERGTEVRLYLKDDATEYLKENRIRDIIKTYADHISFPINLEILGEEKVKTEGEDEEEDNKQLNTGAALWARPKSEITEQQYQDFYRDACKAYDQPWMTLHFKAEGMINYTGLLFIPEQAPFNLFEPDRKTQIKLYVEKIFITDDCEEVLPPWLRFVRGIIDSEDLPLNVSREMLQNQPILAKIKSGVIKKVLSELAKMAKKDEAGYAKFWAAFGAVLKEGIYESQDQREPLLKLTRYYSTTHDQLNSLDDYVARMKPEQKAIYTITGQDRAMLAQSPQLEGYKAKGIEVLYLTDPVDDFWTGVVTQYGEIPFKSVTQGSADLDEMPDSDDDKKDQDAASNKATDEQKGKVEELAKAMKEILADTVKEVRLSSRLRESPVCLVADENGMDLHLERMLKQHKQLQHSAPRILEINPDHALIQSLSVGDATNHEDAAWLLLDQARILDGEQLPDPQAFAKRLNSVLQKL